MAFSPRGLSVSRSCYFLEDEKCIQLYCYFPFQKSVCASAQVSPVSCGWAPSRELNERYTPLICCSIEKGGRLKRNLYPILMRVCVVYFIIIDIVTAQYWGEALVVQQLGRSCATLITNGIFFFFLLLRRFSSLFSLFNCGHSCSFTRP